jgi:alcohol dehydrogenase class IV
MQENPLKIFFPGKLVFGNGTLAQLADDVVELKPSKVFIAAIITLKEVIADLTSSLEKTGIKVLSDTSIVQEPSFNDFEKLMQVIAPFNPDVVIGIGRGVKNKAMIKQQLARVCKKSGS